MQPKVLRDPTWMHGRFLAGTTGRAKAQVRKPTLPARGIAVDLPDERADVASPYSQLLDSATFAGGAGDIDALGDGPVPTDEAGSDPESSQASVVPHLPGSQDR